MNKKLFVTFICLFTATLAWCFPPKGVKTGPNGLKYKQYTVKKDGKQPVIGNVATIHIVARTATDSIFINTYTANSPAVVKTMEPTYKGCFWESFSLMHVGDSIQVWVVADSFFEKSLKGQLPPFVKPGDEISLTLKMVKVQTDEEMQKEAEEKQAGAMAAQKKEIDAYIAAKDLQNVKQTSSGLRYVILKTTDGAQPSAGDKVSAHYTGTLLDGTKFDSSVDRGQPFEFSLGMQQVIAGWDEGISLMRKGEKFLMIIPYTLGYGEQDMGTIPPFSTLVFEIELLDFQKAQ